jgi:tRNA A37 threonylcarbamoyltransferase TsaD
VVELPHQDKVSIAASFQSIAIKHLEQQLDQAMKDDGTR